VGQSMNEKSMKSMNENPKGKIRFWGRTHRINGVPSGVVQHRSGEESQNHGGESGSDDGCGQQEQSPFDAEIQ